MKRIIAAFFCVLILLLSACGTKSTQPTASSPEPVIETEEPAQESETEEVKNEEAESDAENEAEIIAEDVTGSEYAAQFVPTESNGESKTEKSDGWTVAVK